MTPTKYGISTRLPGTFPPAILATGLAAISAQADDKGAAFAHADLVFPREEPKYCQESGLGSAVAANVLRRIEKGRNDIAIGTFEAAIACLREAKILLLIARASVFSLDSIGLRRGPGATAMTDAVGMSMGDSVPLGCLTPTYVRGKKGHSR